MSDWLCGSVTGEAVVADTVRHESKRRTDNVKQKRNSRSMTVSQDGAMFDCVIDEIKKGYSSIDIAGKLGVTEKTVSAIRHRWSIGYYVGLGDCPHIHKYKKMSETQINSPSAKTSMAYLQYILKKTKGGVVTYADFSEILESHGIKGKQLLNNRLRAWNMLACADGYVESVEHRVVNGKVRYVRCIRVE